MRQPSGGNPVAIAASMATFELLESGLLENCQAMGERFMRGLSRLREKYSEQISDLRGLGLMIGMEVVDNSVSNQPNLALRERVVGECFRRGLVILGCGESSIRFSPPLVIDSEQVECALAILDESIQFALSA